MLDLLEQLDYLMALHNVLCAWSWPRLATAARDDQQQLFRFFLPITCLATAALRGEPPPELVPFLAQNTTLPPVSYVQGMQPPTALSWLRRRGPDVGHARLFKLFRERQVRVFDGEKVTRVSRGRALKQGDILLIPRAVAADSNTSTGRQNEPQIVSSGRAARLLPQTPADDAMPGRPPAPMSSAVLKGMRGRQATHSEAAVRSSISRETAAPDRPRIQANQGWLSWGAGTTDNSKVPSRHQSQGRIQGSQQHQATSGGDSRQGGSTADSTVPSSGHTQQGSQQHQATLRQATSRRPGLKGLIAYEASNGDDDSTAWQFQGNDQGLQHQRQLSKQESGSRSDASWESVGLRSGREPAVLNTARQKTAPGMTSVNLPSNRNSRDTAAGVDVLQKEELSGTANIPATVLPQLPVPKRYLLAPGAAHAGLLTAQEIQGSGVELKRFLIGATPEMLFLNKPAGLEVQGFRHSLDALMQTGLRLRQSDEPRLVHRLDRNVSGAMVIARDADAAAWLAACFRDKAAEAVPQSRSYGQGEVPPGMGVRRTYWAIVAGVLPEGQEATMRMGLRVEGRLVPALTRYRVRRSSPHGVSWVELEPVTGRRHQLRIHTARVLGAPILGDVRYGYAGVPPTRGLLRVLPPEWWATFSPTTAHAALSPPTRLERRRAAAAAARARAEARAQAAEQKLMESLDIDAGQLQLVKSRGTAGKRENARLHLQMESGSSDTETDTDIEEGEEEGTSSRRPSPAAQLSAARALSRQMGLPGARSATMPLFLHARGMLVKKAGEDVIRVKAPLPVYMEDVFTALGWPVPAG